MRAQQARRDFRLHLNSGALAPYNALTGADEEPSGDATTWRSGECKRRPAMITEVEYQ